MSQFYKGGLTNDHFLKSSNNTGKNMSYFSNDVKDNTDPTDISRDDNMKSSTIQLSHDIDSLVVSLKNALKLKKEQLVEAESIVLKRKQEIKQLKAKIDEFYIGFNEYFKDDSKTQNDCCICKDNLADLAINGCGHTVCATCVKAIQTCPICRREINGTHAIHYN